MNETITRAAGAEHGQEWPVEDIEAFLASRGRESWLRDTRYQPAPTERREAALAATPLAPVVNTPAARYERAPGERRTLLRNQVIGSDRNQA
jgi:FO synthase